MEQYIPKNAVLAEIEKRIKAIPRGETDKRLKAVYGNEAFVLNDLLSSIDSLEAKEVDLEKEIDLVEDKYRGFESLSRADVIAVAKHFFELGLRASLTEEKYIGNVKGSYTTTTEFKTQKGDNI